MAWLDNWANRLKLTIDSDRVDEDLTDFPVLITLSSGVGRNNFDATGVFDELTTDSGTVFEDDFTSLSGVGWETYGSTAAQYDSGYMYFYTTGHGERTTYDRNYGKYWEVVYHHINRGRGSGDDQYRVESIYSSDGGDSYIKTYMRTYTSGDQYLALIYNIFGAGEIVLHTGTKYNFYSAATNDQATWVKIRRVNNILYFKYWREDQSEPVTWDWVGGIDYTFPTSGRVRVHGFTDGAEGGAKLYYINITKIDPKEQNIAITDSTGTNQLYTEIEQWNPYDEEAYLWTKVPTITSGTDTILYLYYDSNQLDNNLWVGETGTTPAKNVWDDNFVGVWHLAQPPISYVLDSTSSVHYMTDVGSMTSNDLIDGKISKAINFDGSDDYLKTTSADDNLNITDTLTLECLFKPGVTYDVGLTDHRCMLSRQHLPNNSQDSYAFTINADGLLLLGSQGGNIQGTNAVWNSGQWYGVAGTYNSTGLVGDLFVDGTKETLTVDNYDAMAGATNSFVIGRLQTTAQCFDGDIDEVRVSNVVRPDAWIKTTYYSNFDDLLIYEQDQMPVFTCSGTVTVNGVLTDGIPVRLYRRSTGEFIGEYTTISGGSFTIDSIYDEEHYILALYTDDTTNALIYDRIQP